MRLFSRCSWSLLQNHSMSTVVHKVFLAQDIFLTSIPTTEYLIICWFCKSVRVSTIDISVSNVSMLLKKVPNRNIDSEKKKKEKKIGHRGLRTFDYLLMISFITAMKKNCINNVDSTYTETRIAFNWQSFSLKLFLT